MQPDPAILELTRQKLRNQMPIAEKWAYFDHAAVAPLTQASSQAIANWLRQATDDGDTAWLDWARQISTIREHAAQLVGSRTDEIAFVPNTTAGINLVAEGVDWREGDNVVTLDDEFPSNIYPWMHLESLGVETRLVKTRAGVPDMEQFEQACDGRTRVVSISWVGYANGHRRNPAVFSEIAHRHGALFLLDAIQGLGVFPIDVVEAKVDVLTADGHKWLLGPEGAGIAYVNHDCLDRLRPTGVGWNSVVHASDFSRIELDLRSNASRYEGGTQNTAGILGLGASIALFLSLGVENLSAAILEYTSRVSEELNKLGAEILSPSKPIESSGIVSFDIPGYDLQRLRKHCLDQGVVLSCRGAGLRVSAHAYNDDRDLEKLIAALQSYRNPG